VLFRKNGRRAALSLLSTIPFYVLERQAPKTKNRREPIRTGRAEPEYRNGPSSEKKRGRSPKKKKNDVPKNVGGIRKIREA
jgi:hypothetical protein